MANNDDRKILPFQRTTISGRMPPASTMPPMHNFPVTSAGRPNRMVVEDGIHYSPNASEADRDRLHAALTR